MADSLKIGPGAVYREQHHISARREFSPWFTAGWGLLTEGEAKINSMCVRSAWQTCSKVIRKKLGVYVCWHTLGCVGAPGLACRWWVPISKGRRAHTLQVGGLSCLLSSE